MRPSVILLKNLPSCNQKWKDVRTKNFSDVSLGIHASFNLHQVTSSHEVDHPPHQYTSTTMWRSLINAVLGVALMDSAVNSSPSIVSLEHKK